jgi:hypothetical protein
MSNSISGKGKAINPSLSRCTSRRKSASRQSSCLFEIQTRRCWSAEGWVASSCSQFVSCTNRPLCLHYKL